MFSRIKIRLYKLFITIFYPLFVFRIIAKENFVFQEEFIVLICFFFLFGYVVFIKKAPYQIYFNLEKQVLQFMSNFVNKCIIIFTINKQLISSNFINKLFKIYLNCDILITFVVNLFKNKYISFFSGYINQFLNKTIEFIFMKKEQIIEIVYSLISRIYLMN
uniref:ATP synthase F0 subunit b n=1 Tax=Cyanophora paradoxa TaxID=2762 RepID=A0A097PBP7_CYAPA|nr:ATP synthase F0 subunit b [Cyanophora paradoxa]